MKNFLKSRKARLAAAVTAGLATPFGAMAADQTTLIGTAVTEGSANVTAVIAGVIGIAILGFGVGKMLGWFGR
tara:strand:- start:99 stop:317 length:219 start_codon:yes stop_codon:yes gene_type:complete